MASYNQEVVILCAQCHKRVDRIERRDDHASGEIVIRAYCHGEMDEMRMGHEFLMAVRRDPGARHGIAFQGNLHANASGKPTTEAAKPL